MVAWGPAHNSDVHLDSAGFWAPWIIVLAITAGLVFGIQTLKRRWAKPTAAAPSSSSDRPSTPGT
jgi:hypothetical protein